MLEVLSKNATISDYLVLYPKIQWRRCIEATLLVGIECLSKKYPSYLPIEQLEKISVKGLS
jgi:hypothetical protein